MIEFKDALFPNYIFYIDEKKEKARGRDAVAIYSLFVNRYIKSYYSTKTNKWRYKLTNKFGYKTQISTRQIIYRFVYKDVYGGIYEKENNS